MFLEGDVALRLDFRNKIINTRSKHLPLNSLRFATKMWLRLKSGNDKGRLVVGVLNYLLALFVHRR